VKFTEKFIRLHQTDSWVPSTKENFNSAIGLFLQLRGQPDSCR